MAPAVPPAVPPTAMLYLWGSHLGRPGRGTSPAPPTPAAGREPRATKEMGWARGMLWARGHGGAGPCVSLLAGCSCHPASPNRAPPSFPCSCIAPAACSCARAKTQCYFCSHFLAAVEILLLHPRHGDRGEGGSLAQGSHSGGQGHPSPTAPSWIQSHNTPRAGTCRTPTPIGAGVLQAGRGQERISMGDYFP